MVSNDSLDVQALFKKHFQQTPTHVVRAPAPLELLGTGADLDDGLVLAVAVDRYVFIAASPRTDGKIELVSSAFPGRETFWVNELRKNPAANWADDFKGVLDQLRRRGVNFNGFNAAIHNAVPAGVGLDGSAALAVAAALIVRKLFPFGLSDTGLTPPPQRDRKGELPPVPASERLPLARLCRAAEREFAGAPRSLPDTIASLCGKAWSVMSIDCRALTVEQTTVTGEAVVICPSGVEPASAVAAHDELRQQCEAVAQKLGVKALRSVELKQLEAHRSKLTPREYECARHVVGEIARVVAAERALRQDDHRQFGLYLFQSHESSRDYLRNSTKELDVLVELARLHPGCLGAQLARRGFDGATINLVAHHQAQSFAEHMSREFARVGGAAMSPLVCRIVDGAE
jgi:galactokinase